MKASWREAWAARAARWRERRYVVATFLAVYIAHLARYVSWVPRDYYPGGDGFYMYLLARSLAFDGDVDMTNDYAKCGDPWHHGYDYGQGVPGNPYYIGPATIWAPVLVVLRRVITLGANPPEAWVLGCRGLIPYWLGLVTAPLFAALTTYVGYRIARRFVGEKPALVSVLLVGFGSGLNTFGPLWWNYSHLWAAFAVTTACLAGLRVLERPEGWSRWFAWGALIGWAFLMRPHHVLFMLCPFVYTVARMLGAARARRWPLREAALGMLCVAGFLATASFRFATFQAMFGHPWPALSGNVYVQPLHAHPFLVLFSARAGLLYQTPLMWFAVIGVFLAMRAGASRDWARLTFVGLFADFWICSSTLEWAGGATVGPRLLVSFTGLFVAYGAVTLEALGRWATASEARLRRLALAGGLTATLPFAWQTIYGDPPYRMPDVYGGAMRRVLDNVNWYVGNPFTLPATAVFALRYGTHPRNFDAVATTGHFKHTYDTGSVECCNIERFADLAPDVLLLDGTTTSPRGLSLRRNRRARFLVPLSWPTVTDVSFATVRPRRGGGRCSLAVTAGQFSYRRSLGRRAVPEGVDTVQFSAPRWAFDSGINEVILESTCDLEVLTMRWLDSTETDQRTEILRNRRPFVPRPDR